MTSPQYVLQRSTVIGGFPLPPIDEQIREDARKVTGEWLFFADPEIPPEGGAPHWVVQGGYKVDANGELTGEYQINPSYIPSPTVAKHPLGTGFERVLWRTLNGYNPLGFFIDSLYHATLHAYSAHEGDTQLSLVTDPNTGYTLFPVYTSAKFVPWNHSHPVEGSTVFQLMSDSDVLIDINPGTSLSLRMAVRDLAGLINEDTPYLKERALQRQQAAAAEQGAEKGSDSGPAE